jgi:hypothetical protein
MDNMTPFILSYHFLDKINANQIEKLLSQNEGNYFIAEDGFIAYRGSGYVDLWGFCVSKKDTLYPVQYPSGAAIGCYVRNYSCAFMITELGETLQELRRETGILRFTLLQNRIISDIVKKYRCARQGDLLSFIRVSLRSLPRKIATLLACSNEIAQLVFDPRFRQKMKKEKI